MTLNDHNCDNILSKSHIEKRNTQRLELMSPIVCSIKFKDYPDVVAIVRNIGTGGMLVEFQTEFGLDDVDEGTCCTVTDMLPPCYHTLNRIPGSVEWIYHKFVGIAFTERLFRDDDALRDWCRRLKISHRNVATDNV
ncbi:hypothetical protein [Nitratidesulfovibrio sp.]|uniref:hypothetical protein n=1 Tax=Nitratidesulfovibrio sp. TaxID=2802297 RepID=UPI00334201DE